MSAFSAIFLVKLSLSRGKGVFDLVEKIRFLIKEMRRDYVRDLKEEVVSTI